MSQSPNCRRHHPIAPLSLARVFLRQFLAFVTCHVAAPVELTVTLPVPKVLMRIVASSAAQQVTRVVPITSPITHSPDRP